MSKRGGGAKKKSNGLGCLLFVAIAGFFVFASRNTPTVQNLQQGAESGDVGPVFVAVTETRTRVPMATIQRGDATPTPAMTPMWIGSNANARACASTTCEIVAALPRAAAVQVRTWEHGETISGSDIWYQVAHEGEWVYVHSSLLGFSAPAAPRPTQVQQSAPPPQNRDNEPTVGAQMPIQTPMRRPGNCSTAVAMGYSAQQAAQWDHLDRDDDGVACYGD